MSEWKPCLGNNNFKDGVFDWNEWSAPYTDSIEEMKATIDSMKLIGRVIKDIKFLSIAFNLREDYIVESVYAQLEDLHDENAWEKSEYDNIDPDMMFPRYAELDRPILIRFEDGDQFEIDSPQEPCMRMSMNCIPWDIKSDWGNLNADAGVLLDICYGKRIVDVQYNYNVIESEPGQGEDKKWLTAIIFWLDDGNGLCVEPEYDYINISVVDSNSQYIKMPFSRLREGLHN